MRSPNAKGVLQTEQEGTATVTSPHEHAKSPSADFFMWLAFESGLPRLPFSMQAISNLHRRP
jgi:hypothetical protein